MSYRLKVQPDGRVTGKANITYNDPFPTQNGSWGSGAMMGVVMHTEVGYEHSVIVEFNTPAAQASATFSIGVDGHIHQYGPIGKGWYAWAEEAGNRAWYSIEHEDKGDPRNLLTAAQLLASAQIVECLSDYAGFPLQISNHTDVKGYGIHQMGGAAWGGHSCPQADWTVPLTEGRAAQRADILKLARQIRLGIYGQRKVVEYATDGTKSLAEICSAHGDRVASVYARTLLHGLHPRLVAYMARHPLGRAKMPAGIRLFLVEG